MTTVEIRVEGSHPYSIWVGAGILENAASLLPIESPVEALVMIADAAVAKHHGERAAGGLRDAGAHFQRVDVAGGEQTKTMAHAEELLRQMVSFGAHRSDVIAALGGGTIGDLVGFVAALYHRGVPFVQMPTTVLAQVDAAIGGKTAVNLPEGKNLAGAFHQPLAVIADVTTLQTLPDTEFTSGMAEVVKHGFIDDTSILEMLENSRALIGQREPNALVQLVARAAAVKARVVSTDETEQGSRAFLNYGHTLGHALETLGQYGRWRHGEAVAIGMMFAAHLAVGLGYTDLVDEHRRAIEACGLPVSVSGESESFAAIMTAMRRDKKHRHGMRFVVLEEFGKPRLVSKVPDELVRRAYEAVIA